MQGSAIGGFTGFGGLYQFTGTEGAPAQDFGPGAAGQPGGDKGNANKLPVVRESPFVYYDTTNNEFEFFKPKVQNNRKGYDWKMNGSTGDVLPMSAFYIANPTDTVSTLNAQLASGKNLILNPGNYTGLTEPLTVSRANTVIYGLGNAQIAGAAGVQTLKVTDSATGAVLAGFLIGAAAPGAVTPAAIQVQIGVDGGTGSASNPTALIDTNVASRAVTAEVINQDYVIHSQAEVNTSTNSSSAAAWATPDGSYGIVVNGDNVTLQGLYIEHYKKTQLTWNGDKGRIDYLVNEPPYRPYYATPNVVPDTWKMNADFDGWPSISISDDVKKFDAEGYMTVHIFMGGCRCEIDANTIVPENKPGITFRNVLATTVTYPVPAGTTDVHYDPNEFNGESGQVPKFVWATPDLQKQLVNFSGTGGFIQQSGNYAVGGNRNVFGIRGSDGKVTGVGPGNLIPDVAPGPGHFGPGGTSKLPFSDLFGYSITTRITEFAAPKTK